MIWAVDVAVIVVLLLNMLNVLMTIGHRVEPKLYVSLWYITGTVIWFPMLYFIGNVMWRPPTGALTGIDDTIFNWFYGHNVLGLWFTTGLLAVIYYIVPRETNTPLYSHVLSLIAFWGIAFFYTGVGGHHLLWAPIPYWLKTIAVADSIGMILPVAAFMMNIFLTMRGNWNRFMTSIPLRFVITGWAAYILVSYQGSHQALRGINLLTHFTQYVPGHAHLSLLVLCRFDADRRHVLCDPAHLQVRDIQPCPGERRIQSVCGRLYVLLWRLFVDGVGTGHGLGASRAAGLERSARTSPLYADARGWAASCSSSGFHRFLLQHSGDGHRAQTRSATVESRRTSSGNCAWRPLPRRPIRARRTWDAISPAKHIRRIGHENDVYGNHHRRADRVLCGGDGRCLLSRLCLEPAADLYCPPLHGGSRRVAARCSTPTAATTVIRNMYAWKTPPWAIVSQGGNYVFDNPMILGSERTGPDLSYIGRKRSEQWEIEHWKDPRRMSPLSIMPSFEFLTDAQLNDMAAYLFNLGDRTSAQMMIMPPAAIRRAGRPARLSRSQSRKRNKPIGWSAWTDAQLQEGKELYVDRCLTCHGCAGNGLGAYAGTKIVTPANFKQEPFSSMPDDQWFWHVSEGVPGTRHAALEGKPDRGRTLEDHPLCPAGSSRGRLNATLTKAIPRERMRG